VAEKFVLGGFNPCEKHAPQIGNIPQIYNCGENSKIFELPPPRLIRDASEMILSFWDMACFQGRSCKFPGGVYQFEKKHITQNPFMRF